MGRWSRRCYALEDAVFSTDPAGVRPVGQDGLWYGFLEGVLADYALGGLGGPPEMTPLQSNSASSSTTGRSSSPKSSE